MIFPMPMGGVGGQGQGGVPGMSPEEQAPPEELISKGAKYWWALFGLFVTVFVFELVAADLSGALIFLLMSIMIWFMVKDRCVGMTQCCVLCFGFMCAMQLFFALLTLATSVGGRKSQQTTVTNNSDNSVSYTITEESHPFFDGGLGFQYNLQSAMMIAQFVTVLVGTIVSKLSYDMYPNSLFADNGEAQPLGGGDRRFGGFGGTQQQQRPANFGGAQRSSIGSPVSGSSPPTTNLFGGSGQRLGS